MTQDFSSRAVSGTVNHHDMLREAAHADVHLRTSRQIGTHHGEFEHFEYRVERPIPPEAVQSLQLMLRGIHQLALYEWLHTVHQLGYQPQIDVVARLMQFFREPHSPPFYILTNQLFGVQGVQAAQAIYQDVNLTLSQMKLLRVEPLQVHAMQLEHQRKIQLVTQFMEEIETPANLSYVKHIKRPWSRELSELFLETVLNHTGYYISRQKLSPFAYFWSLESNPHMLKMIFAEIDDFISGYESSPKLRDHIANYNAIEQRRSTHAILDFRKHMIATIKGEQ